MADIQGTVTKITSQPRGQRGNLAYSLQIDNGDYYGHGFNQPTCREGDQIEFNIDWNGQYKNVNVQSVRVLNQGGGQQDAQPTPQQRQPQQRGAQQSSYKKPAAGGRDKYWDDKAKDDKARQACIEHQSSRNAAINLLDVLMREEVVKLPAKAAAKFDAAMALVDEITDKFNRDLHPEKYPKDVVEQGDAQFNQDYQPPHQAGAGEYQE